MDLQGQEPAEAGGMVPRGLQRECGLATPGRGTQPCRLGEESVNTPAPAQACLPHEAPVRATPPPMSTWLLVASSGSESSQCSRAFSLHPLRPTSVIPISKQLSSKCMVSNKHTSSGTTVVGVGCLSSRRFSPESVKQQKPGAETQPRSPHLLRHAPRRLAPRL